ncbi:MAG: hypothetical protein LC794_04585 [Acidobacteria bacterium]|nr:hypothetical protein [Acidobacteriota bacterium]
MKTFIHATTWIIFVLAVMGCKLSNIEQSRAEHDSRASITPTPVASPQNSASDISSLDEGVVLRFKVETSRTLKPRIIGETNLPDGTELMVSLDSKSVNYNGSDNTTVNGGRFQSAEFSSNYNNLKAGQYVAEVVMPIPAVQPPSVRAIIGENGEKLKGALVKREDDSPLGLSVRVEQPFQLKSDGTVVLAINQSELANAEKKAIEVLKALKNLEQQGRNMEALRSKDNLDNLRQCGDLMRERQRIADELRTKAESIIQPYTTYLTPAAIEVKLCVSCSSAAMDKCNRARSLLDEAESRVKVSRSR